MLAQLLTGFFSGQTLIVAIGAQNTFVLRQGIRREHLLLIALICSLSDALLITLGVAGLGALIERTPALLEVARYAGAAFLLAYGALAAKRVWLGQSLVVEGKSPVPRLTAVVTCLCLTYLNPHVYLDTVLLLGALANQHGDAGRWVFGAGAILSSFAWFFALSFGARHLSQLFRKPLAWRCLDGFIALIMWLQAISLVAG